MPENGERPRPSPGGEGRGEVELPPRSANFFCAFYKLTLIQNPKNFGVQSLMRPSSAGLSFAAGGETPSSSAPHLAFIIATKSREGKVKTSSYDGGNGFSVVTSGLAGALTGTGGGENRTGPKR